VEGYEANTYGDRFAEVYDDWYGDVTDAAACTERLARLVEEVGGGPVLELGIGSGRLALPLAARGLEVHGIDASAAMLAALTAKPGGAELTVTLGDMAALDLGGTGPFSVVFVAFNTFFNLGTIDEQRRCLQRVAEVLTPTGCFVLEAFVPPEGGADGIDGDGAVTPRHITADDVVLTVSRHDPGRQTITGQHVHITEGGIRLRPWHLRYAAPAELDRLAADAGLTLHWRAAGWRDEPFDSTSNVHVSAYRRGNVGAVRPAVRPQ
jgi:SAM-dependent methyltransferase